MKAPPRRAVAPAALTARAVESVCCRFSTEHGPAIIPRWLLPTARLPARITVESYQDRKFHGNVKKISPLGVEKDKIMNFEVEITIDETGVPLRTNMTADAEIIVAKHENVLLVPQNAIRYKRKQSFVEVPDPEQPTGKRSVDSWIK